MLSLDGTGCQPFDNVLLETDIYDQHGDYDERDRGCHQAVVYTGLGADLVQQTCYGSFFRISQEEGLRKEIIVAPEKRKNSDRGKR